jgi:hypothetical protein
LKKAATERRRDFLIALTCGRDSEWVNNVLTAGGCELETQGVRYRLSDFRAATIVHDPTGRRFLLLGRIVLRLIGASDFMQPSISGTHGALS